MHILTDTCAYFATPRFAKAHNVTVMPIRIRLGAEVVREDEITALELFDAVLTRGVTPELIPPTQQEFATAFETIARQDNVIMSIHCTNHLCPMPTQARLGADLVRGRTTVHVIDTGSVSLGQGLVVEAAVKAAEAGLTLEDGIRLARGKIHQLYSVFFSEHPAHLGRGGQLGAAHALIGQMLEVKPILSLEEGEFVPMEKAQTRAAALEKLAEFSVEVTDIERGVILQAEPQRTADTRQLLDLLASEGSEYDWPLAPLAPSLGVLLGPGAMGVMIAERSASE